jgi:hypothetical protein
MPIGRLQRTYLLRGLDRVLYSTPPQWHEGTFLQTQEEHGHLVLHVDGIFSAAALDVAIKTVDETAERFRLAISKRIGCPLTLALENSDDPSFDTPGIISAIDKVVIGDRIECAVLPRDPPQDIEQIPEAAARWILTLTEARRFGAYPDEVIKRLYLLIEELLDEHAHHLGEDQRAKLQELKWVRDFVSHPTCRNEGLCAFVAQHLPGSVVSTNPTRVRFDRTNVDHRNFVGRYDPIARGIVGALLDSAIAAMVPPHQQ